jgi:hypothetical protein
MSCGGQLATRDYMNQISDLLNCCTKLLFVSRAVQIALGSHYHQVLGQLTCLTESRVFLTAATASDILPVQTLFAAPCSASGRGW